MKMAKPSSHNLCEINEEEGFKVRKRDERPTMLDNLTVFWKKLVYNVTLSLDGKTKGLNKGGNETDDNAKGNRDGGGGGREHGT